MIGKLGRLFAIVCMGTVLTQAILMGYFVSRGTFNGTTLTQTIALWNGIDISGNRLKRILADAKGEEQPDYEEILEARKLESLDMDMRLKSQHVFRDELTTMMVELRDDRDQLDERRASFDRKLDELEKEALDDGLRDAGRTLQSLDAGQAKDQLLIMCNEERIDDVVTIIQAMSSEKRKDILAEFVSAEEKERLAEILRLISEGQPTTALIDGARQNR